MDQLDLQSALHILVNADMRLAAAVIERPGRAVVDAAAGSGHTLRCMDAVQLCFELPVGVLAASVTVKQRMGAGVGSHRSVKGVKNKLIVVGLTQCIRNDAFVMEIKDRTRDRRKFCVIDVPRQYENLRLSQE